MTAPGIPPPGQLDIPLVWLKEPVDVLRSAPAKPPESRPALLRFAGGVRLWVAVLADGGALAVATAVFWGLTGLLASGLNPMQLGLASAAALEAASVVAVGCLWGWRASPGMLLLGVCFSRPIPFGRACRMWICWLLSLLLLGLPLLLRRREESVAERLAGGAVSFRSLPEGA